MRIVPGLTLFHFVLFVGVLIVALPIWIARSSFHPPEALLSSPIPMWPGPDLWKNYSEILSSGISSAGGVSVALMMKNSFIMAFCITFGKIAISLLAAFAIVFLIFLFE